MCMQLCMHGVAPAQNNAGDIVDWSEKAKNLWRSLLREDLPMVISVVKRLNAEDDNRVLPAAAPAWSRPGVLFIQSLKVHGDTQTTLKRFCHPSQYPNNGVAVENAPRPWSYD
ncbi:unnamed protein product [Nippostrongylus brasiliensis]|uniref:Secreted protein n=1 Tax=Nippostrongylus brasiliensis TaxID=27835 RepID=A0A0N4YTC9_NIPBR|nr:unnamed protein product [Nippostrongylus brasiliensis]